MIESLDEYVYMLGVSIAQLRQLVNIQSQAIDLGVLQPEEQDSATAIKYSMLQSIAGMRNLLELIGEHTQIDIEATKTKLQKKLKKRK